MQTLEPVLVVDLFPLERQSLLHLLAQLNEEEWRLLQREQSTWLLGKPDTSDIEQVDASVLLDQETAWRLFTRGISKEEAMQHATFTGDETLAAKVLDTISIIA
ncbi:MAG TPA: hypothetical protein VNG51_22615 [Ktedonobacteraceae bacterium]|nr:hypothetical protein [Ktedonobacteraceae bacterium]